MHSRSLVIAILLWAMVPGGELAAQDAVVERATYRFLQPRLHIHVDSEVPGRLQVVRGRAGRVEVRGLSEGGIAAFGLQDRGSPRLNLTGLGGQKVTWVVVVPARIRVSVGLPEEPLPKGISTMESSALFQWEAPEHPGEPRG